MLHKAIRALRYSSWTPGELLAALVFLSGFLLVAALTLINAGQGIISTAFWLWRVAGGEGGSVTEMSMARAAWAGVAVGIVTIVLLGFTLAYTGTATRISLLSVQQSQALGQAQVRAYVSAHDLQFKFPNGADFTEPPEIFISISNTGQTPARNLRMKMGWQNWYPRGLIRVDTLAPYSVQELGAGQSIQERIPCWDFKEDVLLDHVVGARSSIIRGVIEYTDVFGRDYQTWFRMKISGDYPEARPILYSEQTQDGNLSN